jgi:putative transposase
MNQRYRRHLPHQVPTGHPVFITWNLKGAMPKHAIDCLKAKRAQLASRKRTAGESRDEQRVRIARILFAVADEALDRPTRGPLHLKDPAAAKIVEDAILFGSSERYELFAWCVMANHVHVFLIPIWELSRITRGIKGYTARTINKMHRAGGGTFWQDESYDHWARDDEEIQRIIHYIENNPVAAGICERAEEWPWSSARLRDGWPLGTAYQAPALWS